jgi:NADPH2:quinone reductase
MKAVWYERNGPASEVLVHDEMDRPFPAAGEVLVRLYASGVNPSDVKARAGSRPMAFDRVIPHSDGAGIIEAVGLGGDAHLVGRRVFVRNGAWQRANGTSAEYIALPLSLVHFLPESTSFIAGAALGIPALTAACAVLKDGSVDGETVLIHGGGGTVARLAVQIAVDSGARVIATTGDMSKADWITEAGAAAVLDYKDPDLAAMAKDAAGAGGISRIIDAECGKNLASSVEIIAPKGTILGYGSVLQPTPELPFMNMMFKHVTLSTILVYLLDEEEAVAYAAIVFDMLERRLLDVPVEARFALEDAAAAHELVEAGQRRGAVVLEID